MMIVKAAIVKCDLPSLELNQGLGAQLQIVRQTTFAQFFLIVLFNDVIDCLTHSSQLELTSF